MRSLSFVGFATVILAASSLAGCGSDDSSSLTTSDIRGHFYVEVDARVPETTFRVDLNRTGDAFTDVKLEGGDAITVSTDKDELVRLGASDLKGSIPQIDRTTAAFTLTRASGEVVKSGISIPPAVVLTSPTPGGQVSYGDGKGGIDLVWSNPVGGSNMAIRGFATCDKGAVALNTDSVTGKDTGTMTLPFSKVLTSAPPAGGTCIQILFQHIATGTASSLLGSGSDIQASRLEVVQLTVVP